MTNNPGNLDNLIVHADGMDWKLQIHYVLQHWSITAWCVQNSGYDRRHGFGRSEYDAIKALFENEVQWVSESDFIKEWNGDRW